MAGVKLRHFTVDIAATEFLALYRLLVTNYFFSSARMNRDPRVDLRFSGTVPHKVKIDVDRKSIMNEKKNI